MCVEGIVDYFEFHDDEEAAGKGMFKNLGTWLADLKIKFDATLKSTKIHS